MDIARIFRRRSRPRDQRDPFRRFVQILLECALADNASAIVFGIPHDVPWDFDAELKEEREGMAEAEAELNEGYGCEPIPWPTDDSFLTFPNGASDLPIWYVVNGERRRQMSTSLTQYPYVLLAIADALTSIGGSGLRFIEIPPASAGSSRRFVEVRQTMERDDTVTLHVLGVREVGDDVRVGPTRSFSC